MTLALSLIATLVVSVLAVECALRLPLLSAGARIAEVSRKAGRVMTSSAISDHWKEKVLLVYAGRTFRNVGLFLVCLAALLAVVGGVSAIASIIQPGFLGFLTGWVGLAASFVFATIWAVIRPKGRTADGAAAAGGYSARDKLLHRLALGNRAVAEMSFDIDQAMAKPDLAEATLGRHVFVAGLARAGTTALMRAIHDSGAFRSLTYADMPFVLAPNLWAKMRGQKAHGAAVERAHGDGIMVSTDSPESLDEVFWRTFDGESYIGADRLDLHAPDQETKDQFRSYVGAILKSAPQDRYLSKNNNNILRLPALAEMFPNAVILVPFRDPVAHAMSLMRQHDRFVASHAEDAFNRDYMGWLVHHEFGSDHRPFVPEAARGAGPDQLVYWLRQWVAVYGRLLAEAGTGARFVCYEDLCTDPAVWEGLAGDLGIPADSIEAEFVLRTPPAPPADLPAADLEAARALYADLRAATAAAAPLRPAA